VAFQTHSKSVAPAPAVSTVSSSRGPSVAVATAAKATAATTLAILLTVGTPVAPAFAAETATSSAAARISINQIPPKTISIQVGDLPIVGGLLSGTYAKIDDDAAKKDTSVPSVLISSPKDKIKAFKAVTTGGHVEFDVGGKAGISTHLDVDIAADEAGVAKVRVASDLIPPLPFKNLASSSFGRSGGKESQWNIVTNMGNGESYYFNTKTSVTQYEKPNKF